MNSAFRLNSSYLNIICAVQCDHQHTYSRYTRALPANSSIESFCSAFVQTDQTMNGNRKKKFVQQQKNTSNRREYTVKEKKVDEKKLNEYNRKKGT